MKNIFVTIYRFLSKNKSLMWVLLAAVVTLSCLSISRISFSEDIGGFLPDNGNNARINYAYQHLGGANKIMLNICAADTARIDLDLLAEAAENVTAQLALADTAALIKEITYGDEEERADEVTRFVLENLPYFLDDNDYQRIDSLLSDENIERQLANDKLLVAAPNDLMQTLLTHDPLFLSATVLQKLEGFKPQSNYQLINNHLFNKQATEAVVVVTSKYPVSETMHNAVLLQQIDDLCDQVEQEYDGKIAITAFGASQVSMTNARQIKHDSLLAVVLSLGLIVALLLYYYRDFRSILLIIFSVTVGGIFASGLIACLKNPVSIIAVGIASIILCIAINYPIHFLSHLRKTEDKELIIKEIVTPLLIGNLTTVGAFLSLLFISSPAMKDLGLFAALFLLGTILFVLIFLPHLMKSRYYGRVDKELAFKNLAEFKPEKHPWIFFFILLLTLVLYFFNGKTTFDTNMHHLNYMTGEQQRAFAKLTAESDTTVQTVYCIAEGKTTDEALVAQEKVLRQMGTLPRDGVVSRVCGVGGFLPSAAAQRERLDRWNAFWESRRAHCLQAVSHAAAQQGFTAAAFQPFYTLLNTDFQVQDFHYFAPITQNLATSYVVQDTNKTLIYNILYIKKDKASPIVEQLNRLDGRIFAFSDSSIAARLVEALSADFDYVLFLCGCIVFLFLLVSFGRLEITLMAFLPLVIAWIWISGLMGMMDIRFNIVNVILATFIFGQGDDYAIFVTEGLIYEYKYGKKMLSQFKNSILLSSFIMFIGIGMLIFARHPAMRSLAEVVMVGMFSVVLMAYLVPPFIFKWLTHTKKAPRRYPVTLVSFFRTFICFFIFCITAMSFTLYGFLLFTFFGKTDRNKLLFHRSLSAILRVFARLIPLSLTIQNTVNEDFTKPSVIIANHKSHLDLLYLLLLHPKIIALTNERVWHNPFYGIIIHYADFQPLTGNIDACIDNLRPLVGKGYSILIFPEGTRSLDTTILKFHEGAAYIAQKLNLDILPIVLHGTGYAFPKDEFLLRRGSVTLNIGPRITPDNEEFRGAKSRLTTTKLLRQLIDCQYKKLAKETENALYFRDMIYHNYLYKGRDIAVETTKKLAKKKLSALQKTIDTLPETGTLLYRNAGCGQIPLLIALIKKELTIVAVESDDEKRAVATHCAQVPHNLQYCVLATDEHFDFILDEKTLTL